MFYTVECSYNDPESENAWNTFYSQQKLPALLSVKGFRTSQRFKTLNSGHPQYFALHTLRDEKVLTSEQYRLHGGGNFSRWQPCITDWRRNLYSGECLAPAVSFRERLLLSEQPQSLIENRLGYPPLILQAAGLDCYPRQRVAYVISLEHVGLIAEIPGIVEYQPLTLQLHNLNADEY